VGIPSPSSLQKDSCHLFSSPPTIPFLSLSPAKPPIGSINIPLRAKKDSRERTCGELFRMIKIQQHHLTMTNIKSLMGFKIKPRSSTSAAAAASNQSISKLQKHKPKKPVAKLKLKLCTLDLCGFHLSIHYFLKK
jgi:hypothetical protein